MMIKRRIKSARRKGCNDSSSKGKNNKGSAPDSQVEKRLIKG